MSDHQSPSGKLIVGREGPVTTITLNRPECHNALDREVSDELNAAVKEISVDRECRVVILRGAGDTFCAGDDVKEFNDWAPEDFIWQVRMYQDTVTMIDNLVPVTIAAAIAGTSPAAFSRHILPMLETENGRVVTRSLERNLDRIITPEVYLAADRKRDGAREYQRARRHGPGATR